MQAPSPDTTSAQLRHGALTHCRTNLGGKNMKPKKYARSICEGISALALFISPIGCGEDPQTYDTELLAMENPVSSKEGRNDKKSNEVNLSESNQSEFGLFGYGPFGYYPWTYPLYDYYLDPVPFAVPVNPGLALIDYVHPFYAYAQWNPFSYDDDDGLHHGFHDDDF